MAYFYYRTLSRDLIKAFKKKTLTEEDIRNVYFNLTEENLLKKRTLKLTLIIIGVAALVLSSAVIVIEKNFSLIPWMLLMTALLLGLAYLFLYLAFFFIINRQFNHNVKKYYPELKDIYKL